FVDCERLDAMRRLKLFLSRFVLGLWLMLFGSFLMLLVVEARQGGVTMPMAGVSINESATIVDLPNRIFTCTETGPQIQCQATVQDRSLVLNLAPYENDKPDSVSRNCQATYDGRSVRCDSQYLQYAPMLSEEFEVRGLDLSPQQLQTLQRKYWGIRALMAIGERRLILLTTGLSISAGAIAAYFAWFYPSRLTKCIASIACGFVMYLWVRSFLNGVQFDTVIAYGLTVDRWIWLINYGSAVIAIAAATTVALLLRRRVSHATKAVVTLSSGIGSVLIVGNFLFLMLLGSGFVD
ncbi:MAG: hypothetical protein AAGL17_17150, partial [Cyanobacteria bacterium J06576_12]